MIGIKRRLVYEFKLWWLNFQYGRKLAQVQRDRWKNCKRGMLVKQRQVVHEWAANERFRLYQETYGMN